VDVRSLLLIPGRAERRALVAIAVAQSLCVALLVIDPRLAVALVGMVVMLVVALRWPFAVITLLLATRLGWSAALSVHVGWVNLSAFEPAFMLAVVAVCLRSLRERRPLLVPVPVLRAMVLLVAWIALSLAWSPAPGEGLQTVVRLVICLGMVWLMASEVRSLRRLTWAMRVWVVVPCVMGAVAMLFGGTDGPLVGDVSFKSMSGGGRMSGLGVPPNWFAMNMAWAIQPALLLALMERRRLARMLAFVAAAWLLVVAASTGSRGATCGVLLGSLYLGWTVPRARGLLVRFWALAAVPFALAASVGMGVLTAAYMRIGARGLHTFWDGNVRFSNWRYCYEMVVQSLGLGAGVGGYEAALMELDPRLAASTSAYPHGIFWDVMAHQGVVGLLLLGVLGIALVSRYRSAVRRIRGTDLEVWLHGMAATALGYWAHSWVEFRLLDKPMWTFLGIFVGVTWVVDRSRRGCRH